jgi:type IX secretion system PorP/SprF family membrane protein
MKRIILNIAMLFLSYVGITQQLHIVSQYDQHRFLHNPAAAGTNGHASVGVTYRSMWAGISGGPVTQMLYGEKYFSKTRLGMGAFVYNDVTGPTKRTGIQYAINYRLPLNAEGTRRIAFGMEVRGLQYRIDKALLLEAIPGDPVLSGGDKLVKGDAGVGVLYTDGNLNIGGAISQLVQGELRFADVLNAKERAQLYRHYYLMADYTWRTDDESKIIPSIQIIHLPAAPVDIAGGIRVVHKDVIWWGLHHRYKQSWMFNVGYIIKHKFSIGYAYDLYKTPLSIFNRGSYGHEVMLRYDFKK